MAENPSPSASSSTNKAGIFAKARKFSSRTKAKVLQNLGKAERTQDEVFTDNCLKIEKQQEVATHLQKELKKYMHCVRDLFTASKSFHAALSSTYEDEWTEQENFNSQVQTFELLWNDYLQSLQDKVAAPMGTYLQSFPILKNKVTKRNRKMVDFDNSRHNLEVLQAAKKKDELKITRATEELSSAKQIYEGINNDLHSELPEFYNSRVTFYADLFSSLYGSEYVFHSELGKSNGNLGDVCTQLGKDFEQYAYKPKRPISKSISTNSVGEHVNGDAASPTKEDSQPVYVNAGEKKVILEEDSPAESSNDRASSPEDDQEPGSPPRAAPRISMPVENGESKDDSSDDEDNEEDDDVKKIETTAAVRGVPFGVTLSDDFGESIEDDESDAQEGKPVQFDTNDLFGEPIEDAATKQDPFGQTKDDPFKDLSQDPFGEPAVNLLEKNAEDPFASFEQPTKDPFEQITEDPFKQIASDPFVQTASDPFEQAAKDPFEQIAQEDPFQSAKDPFALLTNDAPKSPAQQILEDPFGQLGQADPFEQVKSDPIGQVNNDPFGQISKDPFQQIMAEAVQQSNEDPFASLGDSITEETKVEAMTPATPKDDNDEDDDKAENLYSTPPATDKMKVEPPENMLFMAQATHKYAGEDVDELTFEPGEVIFVIAFDNPDEQDDGWLMGIAASTGLKGVFPENFTRRL